MLGPIHLLHSLATQDDESPLLTVKSLPSPNHYRGRGGVVCDTVVLHYDASRKRSALSTARVFQSPAREASAHFCIGDALDDVVQCVDLMDAAWHAGDGGKARIPTGAQLEDAIADGSLFVPIGQVSPKPGHMNRRSIGIEQRNRGWAPSGPNPYAPARHRNPASTSRSWETWGEEQIITVGTVLRMCKRAVPTLRWVCGHEDATHGETLGDITSTVEVERKAGAKLDPGPLFPWDRLPLASLGLRRVQYDFGRHGWSIG